MDQKQIDKMSSGKSKRKSSGSGTVAPHIPRRFSPQNIPPPPPGHSATAIPIRKAVVKEEKRKEPVIGDLGSDTESESEERFFDCEEFLMKQDENPMRNPMRHGDSLLHYGEFPVRHGEVPMRPVDLPMRPHTKYYGSEAIIQPSSTLMRPTCTLMAGRRRSSTVIPTTSLNGKSIISHLDQSQFTHYSLPQIENLEVSSGLMRQTWQPVQ